MIGVEVRAVGLIAAHVMSGDHALVLLDPVVT